MPKKNIKEESLELTSFPSKQYEKFFSQFEEIKTLPTKDWKIQHILGYFAAKFKEYYNVDFTFDMKGATPSKMTEVFFIKKLSQMLSSKPEILKGYIDWIFKEKIQDRKRIITSLGYLATPSIINEYKFNFLFNKKIERSSTLPQEVLDILQKYSISISTYGELSFLKMSQQYSPNTSLNLFFDELSQIFDISILESLK